MNGFYLREFHCVDALVISKQLLLVNNVLKRDKQKQPMELVAFYCTTPAMNQFNRLMAF